MLLLLFFEQGIVVLLVLSAAEDGGVSAQMRVLELVRPLSSHIVSFRFVSFRFVSFRFAEDSVYLFLPSLTSPRLSSADASR